MFDELRDGDRVGSRRRRSDARQRADARRLAGPDGGARGDRAPAPSRSAGRSRPVRRNTVAHMVEEQDLLSGRFGFPSTRADFRDRHVLVVVRGDHQADLKALRPYIRDLRPVIVAVDGGATAILEAGFQPDMIVGDMDSASDARARCGAELDRPRLSRRARTRTRAAGRRRPDHKIVPAPGTSQDVAMLMAHEKGASLIVTVGSHFNLVEFLDTNRGGMSSTFLTRLRLGEKPGRRQGRQPALQPQLDPGPGRLLPRCLPGPADDPRHHLAGPQRHLRAVLAEDPHLARRRDASGHRGDHLAFGR